MSENTAVVEAPKALEILESGEIVVRDNTDLVRVFTQLLKSRVLPKHIQTPEQLFVAHQLITGIGVRAWVTALGDTWINPQTNKMDLCNNLPLAACMLRREEWRGSTQYFLNKDGERMTEKMLVTQRPESAVYIAHRKDLPDQVGQFSKWEAEAAGLIRKDNYQKWFPRMYVARAKAIGLKEQWADVLKGARIAEHDSGEFLVRQASGGRASLPAAEERVVLQAEPQSTRDKMLARIAEAKAQAKAESA